MKHLFWPLFDPLFQNGRGHNPQNKYKPFLSNLEPCLISSSQLMFIVDDDDDSVTSLFRHNFYVVESKQLSN